MNIWSKMLTALKGGANQLGEAVVDENALRILDQEIRNASEDLNQTKQALAATIANQKSTEQEVTRVRSDLKTNEEYVLTALQNGDEALALEIAERVAMLENNKSELNKSISNYKTQADTLRNTIQSAESQLKKLKQQTETIKATEALQRAQQVIAQRYSSDNPRLRTALDSLERIKQQQSNKDAEIQADIELAKDQMEDQLDRKLREAGISDDLNAQKVLQRIKNKKR